MKTKKKLLIALLSVTCLTAGAFGLASCTTQSTNDPAMYALYQKYVAGVEEGQTALSYEAWLEDVMSQLAQKGDQGEPGEAGAKGDKGDEGKSAYDLYVESVGENGVPMSKEEWLRSLVGQPGRGIEKVEMSADGNSLLVTFTGSTSPVSVALPDKLTHEHTYGDEITVVIPATSDSDGLGYKKCLQDEHVELVVIPQLKYTVTLVYPDGTPATDIGVTINTGTGTTDENGVAVVTGFGEVGDYAIEIDKEGYEAFGAQSTGTSMNLNLTVVKKAASGTGATSSSPLVFSGGEIGSKETFGVYVNSQSADSLGKVYARLTAGKSAPEKYKVTVNSEYAYYIHSNPNNPALENGNTSFEVVVPAGSGYTFQLTMDLLNLPPDITYPGTVAYTVTVERLEEPAQGVYELPIALSWSDEQITAKTEPGAYVYYKWTNDWEGHKNYAFTFGEGMSATFIGNAINASQNEALTSGKPFTFSNVWESAYFFKVQADENGDVAFTANKYWYEGEKGNPLTADHGETYTGTLSFSGGVREKWYTYTAAETGEIAVELARQETGDDAQYTSNTCIDLYTGSPEGYDYETLNGKIVVYSVTEGTTYYFRVSNESQNGDYKFTVRDAESTDYGYSTDSVAVLTAGTSHTATDAKGMMYYKLTAENLGRITIEVTDAEGNALTAAQVDAAVYNNSFYWYKENKTLFKEGETAYIGVNSTVDGYVITVKQTQIVKADHEITVKSGDTLLKDVVVVARSGSTEVARATTNEQGVAVLNMVPGAYSILLEEVPEAYNYYTKVSTTLPEDGSRDKGYNYTVELDAKVENTFTVKSGETLLENVTVNVMSGTEVIATGVTGANGTVELTFFPGVYTISVEGFEEDDYAYNTTVRTMHSTEPLSLDIELVAKVSYTVKVTKPDGTGLKDITVKLAQGSSPLTGVTDENGSVTFDEKIIPGSYAITLEGLPEGYIGSGSTSATETTVTIALLDISSAIVGESSASAGKDVALPAGSSLVYNNGAENWYSYTATGDGTITVRVAAVDTAKAYIGTLYVNGTSQGDRHIYNGQIANIGKVSVLSTIQGQYNPYTGKYTQLAVEIKVQLSAGEYVVFGLNTGSTGIMSIAIDDSELTESGGDTPITGNVLTEGNNTIALTAKEAFDGKEYTFTSENGGTYTISAVGDDDELVLIMDESCDFDNPLVGSDADGVYTASHTFSLEAGESITFVMAYLWSDQAYSYDVVISAVE